MSELQNGARRVDPATGELLLRWRCPHQVPDPSRRLLITCRTWVEAAPPIGHAHATKWTACPACGNRSRFHPARVEAARWRWPPTSARGIVLT